LITVQTETDQQQQFKMQRPTNSIVRSSCTHSEDNLECLRMTTSRRKSLESWPMPNLLKYRETNNNGSSSSSSSSSSGEIIKKHQFSYSTTPPARHRRRQTISDLKKKQNNNYFDRIKSSFTTKGKISFKDTLLRRRRSSSVLRTSINQNAYLEILRDLSIEEKPQTTTYNFLKNNNTITTTNDNYNDVKTDNNNNNNNSTAVVDDYPQHYDDNDVEPLTLTHEEDYTLCDDIADAISSL
jgi:hypothetical protein